MATKCLSVHFFQPLASVVRQTVSVAFPGQLLVKIFFPPTPNIFAAAALRADTKIAWHNAYDDYVRSK